MQRNTGMNKDAVGCANTHRLVRRHTRFFESAYRSRTTAQQQWHTGTRNVERAGPLVLSPMNTRGGALNLGATWRWDVLVGVFTLASCLVGCSVRVNPFKDEFQDEPPVTTPSVDMVRAAHVAPRMPVRAFEQVQRVAEEGAVRHGPIYFEDPYEENGSEDGRFSWTWEDYWQVFYWRGRFLVNAVIFPVRAVLTPPWRAMVSDGHLEPRTFGELHDPVKCNGNL